MSRPGKFGRSIRSRPSFTGALFNAYDELHSEMVADEDGNYHFVDLRIKVGENYRFDFAYHDDKVISDNELELTQCGIIGHIE